MSTQIEAQYQAIYVEDSDFDAELFQTFVQKLHLPARVEVIRLKDGQEALDFIASIGDLSEFAKQSLVILDLGLPKIGGRDVLKHLRSLWECQSQPQIIILSGSANQQDRDDCLALGANAYFIKPFGMLEYKSLITGPIHQYLQNLIC